MTDLDLCAAQFCSTAGDLDANIAGHLRLMRHAAGHGVQFLMFPELSLTGYEPTLARELALLPDSARLQPLRDLARQTAMTTVVGLPLRQPGSDEILIGALVFAADGSQAVYSKLHLHPGEEVVFSPGHSGDTLLLRGERVAISVCADFTHASHVQTAADGGALFYVSSVLIGEGGYPRDSALLQGYARQHSLGVLMANHGGPSGGWACAGRSAFWSADGELVVSAEGVGNCLVVARRRGGRWQGEVFDLGEARP